MDERVLILAPHGRDAAVAADLLHSRGIATRICDTLPALLAQMAEGAGAVLVTEEAIAGPDAATLIGWIADQPTWSDLPFVVLANGSSRPRSAAASGRLDGLGNMMLLERPLHADAMLGAVRSALTARRRQYQVRGAAAALEQAVADRTAELETARAGLEVALDAADMGSWDIDLTTGEARRTLRHDQIFGFDRIQPHWDIDTFLARVDAEARPGVAAAFEAAPRTGSLDIECPITTIAGVPRWIAAKGRVRYVDGVPVRMTGIVSDVTDRRDADAQLAQAAKMDTIGQLTGGVAHDFNNLLTPIVGSLDLLRRRHGDDVRSQRYIAVALQAAEQASTLNQRLLAFARRQALLPRSVDVATLIHGMTDLVRRSLGPTIHVVVDLPGALPAVRVDPNQLELALLNLAVNARDAMPGGGRLSIAAAVQAVDDGDPVGLRAGGYVRLIAADTGIGMDKATLTRAVEPFFSTKGLGKGTGLGLSMIHGLAAQSGGTLRIESEVGRGTSIELWLPVSDEAADDADADESEPLPAPQHATVLLVDDEEIVRTATADMLRDLGYSVVEMPSASQAIAAIRSGVDVDVLVTDYLMPGMTGASLIHELRAMGAGLPTLLVTGYAATGEDVPHDVPRLAKPFRQADIAAQVHLLLTGCKGRVRLRAVN
jgi:signal transduction histidine kinase/CheY-like chemotaxis protein